jgi:tetratricopeptide (TPR) repeat protein
MSEASGKSQEPGRVSRLADARGGPANFAGVSYQVLVQVEFLFDRILALRHDPTSSAVIRCEARELLGGGQYGWDVAIEDETSPARLIEVKLAPVKAEVFDLLARARVLSEEGSAQKIGLVAGSSTPSYEAFARLCRHAGEGVDDAAFEERVRAHQDATEIEFFEALGAAPSEMMARVLPPVLQPVGPLTGGLQKFASLSAVPGRGADLVNALIVRVTEASARREAVLVADVIREMTARGLLAPATAVMDRPENSELMAILVVLDLCPVPLPEAVLVEATGLSVEALAALVAPHVAAGWVAVDERRNYARAVSREHRLGVEFGGSLVSSVLRQLCVAADSSGFPEIWAWQTPNAEALARALGTSSDEVVADAFRCFDKPCKAYGDLWVTERFARMSADAIGRVMQTSMSEQQEASWAYARAQTWICGHAWVWQRVGKLAACVELMDRAESLAREYDDKDNLAFVLKCKGRLQRMRAEDASDSGEADVLFADSVELLERAYRAFVEIVRTKPKYFEDRGECVALLARTLAATGDLEKARETVERAHVLLDSRPASKAFADLVLLECEIAMPDDPVLLDSDVELRGLLSGKLAALDGLVHVHDANDNPGDSHHGHVGRASEIAARVYIVRGSIRNALGDRAGAADDLGQAVKIYEQLGHQRALDRAQWRLIELNDDPLPAGLLEAFERNRTSEGARVYAFVHLGEVMSAGKANGIPVTVPAAEDRDYWDGVVTRSARTHAARTPNWDEGRETA